MIYTIKTMGGTKISIESEEDLEKFLEQANLGMRLVLTKHGIVNPASVDSIVLNTEANEAMRTLGGKNPQDILGVSPFAKLLSEKMTMLSPQKRTEAQEKAAREIRKIKND